MLEKRSQRLQIYLREMFPIKLFLPFAIINHYILFFTVQILMGAEMNILSLYSIIGVITIFGFMLIMRIFDELKDEVIDKELFATRPYPRGDVSKSDLLLLLFTTILIVVVFNSIRSYTLPFFLVSVFYGYLTYKWFFLRKLISTKLFLALISHQPLTLLLNTYVASTAMVQTNVFEWTPVVYLSIVIFFIPVLSWEISRKIKAAGTENAYVTYSRIWGTRGSAFIAMVIQTSFSIGMIWLGIHLDFHFIHIIIQLLVMNWMIFIYGRFWIFPSSKNLKIKKTSELHSTISSMIYLIFLFIHYGLTCRWFIQ